MAIVCDPHFGHATAFSPGHVSLWTSGHESRRLLAGGAASMSVPSTPGPSGRAVARHWPPVGTLRGWFGTGPPPGLSPRASRGAHLASETRDGLVLRTAVF